MGRLWRWTAVVVVVGAGGHHDQSLEDGGMRCRAVAVVTVLVGLGCGGRGVTGEKKIKSCGSA